MALSPKSFWRRKTTCRCNRRPYRRLSNRNEKFPSNWELSAARAASVIRIFEPLASERPRYGVAFGTRAHCSRIGQRGLVIDDNQAATAASFSACSQRCANQRPRPGTDRQISLTADSWCAHEGSLRTCAPTLQSKSIELSTERLAR